MALLGHGEVPDSTEFMPLLAVKDEPLSEGGDLTVFIFFFIGIIHYVLLKIQCVVILKKIINEAIFLLFAS